MPRHRPDENLRARLLDACEAQLAAGPASVTARDVASRAEVSNGTLYHYFSSIDELLLAVARRAAARQEDTFGDLSKGVTRVLRRLFDVERRDTLLPWLRQRAVVSPALAVALRQYDREVNEVYVRALESGAQSVGLRPETDLEAAVEVVRALAEGFQLRLASTTLAVEPDRFADTAIEAVTRAWFASDPPDRPT